LLYVPSGSSTLAALKMDPTQQLVHPRAKPTKDEDEKNMALFQVNYFHIIALKIINKSQ
jgi:hypothetical protein